ncbi:MAG: cytochrome c biogenesis protein ResB [Verrucomicrobiales bacterium]|nr:cytochrome c biogenesis protein ResB [Verrucomicrobiales bacterium]
MSKKPVTPWTRLLKFTSSFGLACVVLFLFFILTLLGTLEQVEHGLYETQKRYFDSLFVWYEVAGMDLPLIPGVRLLMWVLFFNILSAAILKMRKGWKGAGLLIAHGGILLLLVGGAIGLQFKHYGAMMIWEGDKASEFESYTEWQLDIMPVDEEGKVSEALVIPAKQIDRIASGQTRVFTAEELPFDFVVHGREVNSMPIPAGAPMAASAAGKEIDGYKLMSMKPAKQAEQNLPGMYVSFPESGKDAGEVEAILWGGDVAPYTLKRDGKRWAVKLVKEKWKVPFEIKLRDFHFEYFPGTQRARVYRSDVTKLENGTERDVRISMNQPLRHKGYTFFQSSFGPAGSDDKGDQRMYTVFAVMQNPADHWPLASLIVSGVGLLIHFLIQLGTYLKRQRKTQAKQRS